jgi:hypothetical protein
MAREINKPTIVIDAKAPVELKDIKPIEVVDKRELATPSQFIFNIDRQLEATMTLIPKPFIEVQVQSEAFQFNPERVVEPDVDQRVNKIIDILNQVVDAGAYVREGKRIIHEKVTQLKNLALGFARGLTDPFTSALEKEIFAKVRDYDIKFRTQEAGPQLDESQPSLRGGDANDYV